MASPLATLLAVSLAASFAARQELGEVGHDVVTFCLGGLVATGTVGL